MRSRMFKHSLRRRQTPAIRHTRSIDERHDRSQSSWVECRDPRRSVWQGEQGAVAMNSPDRNGRYDLVVLGSGSSAFAAALGAQELGKTVVMTESRAIGGTCVNRGCLPSKNLI